MEASFTLKEVLINHSLFTDLNNDALGTSQVQLILYYTCANNSVQVPRPYTLCSFSFYSRVWTCHKAQAHKNDPVKSWKVTVKYTYLPKLGACPEKIFIVYSSVILGTKGFK